MAAADECLEDVRRHPSLFVHFREPVHRDVF
jgi:hypothetical protein